MTTKDGERLVAWYAPAREGCPLIVFLHGNNETISQETGRFTRITEACFGLLAVDYRGYGGSSGHPTEAGLIEDAHAAYRYAAEQVGPGRVVMWGYSLGTGPAVAVAADSSIAGLVLEAPFSSLADVAADDYPFVPVRLLMKDPMHSIDRVSSVRAPVFIMHGGNDQVIPIRFGRRLYEAIPGSKIFKEYPDASHIDVGAFGLRDAFAFLKSSAVLPSP
ncbi:MULTISPECIES: alpha/beta hydrolase [unclassified Bradyrhizobium]